MKWPNAITHPLFRGVIFSKAWRMWNQNDHCMIFHLFGKCLWMYVVTKHSLLNTRGIKYCPLLKNVIHFLYFLLRYIFNIHFTFYVPSPISCLLVFIAKSYRCYLTAKSQLRDISRKEVLCSEPSSAPVLVSFPVPTTARFCRAHTFSRCF